MLTFTQILAENSGKDVDFIFSLTAEERTRSRYIIDIAEQKILLKLPRGTILKQGDLLLSENGNFLAQVECQPEPVLTITAPDDLTLLRTAYHLGNRHTPLEITPNYLRLSPDPVLQSMLETLNLQIIQEIAPFHPETGIYRHHH